MSLFQLEEASFAYGAIPVLEGLSLQLERGSFTGLVGPNGAGKSTLLRLLAGLLSPTHGRVLLDGAPVAAADRRRLSWRLAVVPQEVAIPFPFTVRELVRMALYSRRAHPFMPAAGERERVERALAAADLAGLADRTYDRLSGGERRRAILAGALAQEPEILLLDEPTAGLDWGHAAALFAILERANRERAVTVLVASHDLNLASLWCRRMLLLDRGRVAAWGETEEVLETSRLEAVYGVALERLAGGSGLCHLPRRPSGPGGGA